MAGAKKPRIRKVETVRDRATKKAEATQQSGKKGPIRRLLKLILKPVAIIFTPLKFIGRFIVPKYFRNSYKELKQVSWPTQRETWKLTFAVLIFALSFGFLVVLTDYGLDKVIRRIVLR